MIRTLKWFAAALAFYSLALCQSADAQQCNQPSGFLKSFGPMAIGDALGLGPDCEHLVTSGMANSKFGVVNVKSFGAKGDAAYPLDCAITSGSSTLTCNSVTFTADDVGKQVTVAGAGVAGANLGTSIAAIVGPGVHSVALTNTASTTVNAGTKTTQYCTDDTVAFNQAIASGLPAQSISLWIPPGQYCVYNVNLANNPGIYIDGVPNTFAGAGCTPNFYNAGSILVPVRDTTNGGILDLTGAVAVRIRNIQIGNGACSPVTVASGLLIASSATKACTLHDFNNVFISGKFAAASLYIYGCQDSRITNSFLYNYHPTNATVVACFADNAFSQASVNTTIVTGNSFCSGWSMIYTELHQGATGPTTTPTLSLRGVGLMELIGTGVDNSSKGTASGAIFCVKVAGTNCRIVFLGSLCYTEQPGNEPDYCFVADAGSGASLAIFGGGNSETFTIAKTNGTVTFEQLDGATTPTLSLTNGHIFVGNGSNVATDVAMSGDTTIVAGGAVTIANNAVTTAKINNLAVTNGKLANMPALTLKGNNTGGSAAANDLTFTTVNPMLNYSTYIAAFATGVNFNAVGDTTLNITLPGGITNWRLFAFSISNEGTTASLTTAQYGIFSGAGGTGTALQAGGTSMAGLTSNAVNGNQSMISTGGTFGAKFNFTTVFFRITTAQGAAASGSVYLVIQPLP